MDEKTRQALGLLVVAALGGLLWLVMTLAGADRDESAALWALMFVGGVMLAVCGVVGLARLASVLLRPRV